MDETSIESAVQLVDPGCLAERIRMNQPLVLLDARSFMAYNTSHIIQAVNIGGNRAFRRKFFQVGVPIDSFIQRLTCFSHDLDTLRATPIFVYDQCLDDIRNLRPDCFVYSLLGQLSPKFCSIFVLKGGFLNFRALYPDLCWESSEKLIGEDVVEYHQSDCALERLLENCLETSLSHSPPVPSSSSRSGSDGIFRSSVSFTPMTAPPQPTAISGIRRQTSDQCLSYQTQSSFPGSSLPESPRPSPVLPHLVLGSQPDALSATVCQQYGITHVINVSVDGLAPPHISAQNFLRISVNDNYTDRMRPYFEEAFQFIDRVKVNRGRVLVHCSAGISRSPTLAIAYLMYSCRMSLRKAYGIIKSGRPTVAPNFNFLGQLVEFERELFPSEQGSGDPRSPPIFMDLESTTSSSPAVNVDKIKSPLPSSQSNLTTQKSDKPIMRRPSLALAPTTSLSPKHSMTKKRDRPTYLSLEAPGFSAVSRANRNQCAGRSSANFPGLSSDVSPNEGKRSRVSCLSTFAQGSSSLLPSPCTVLSRLELSSPSDECMRSIAPSQPLSIPGTSVHSRSQRPYNITAALCTASSTSLDKLHFEPCSVSNVHPSCARGLRRSITSLGVHTLRPTLLAERRLSSQFSAPVTPRVSPMDVPDPPVPRLIPGDQSVISSIPTNPMVPSDGGFGHNCSQTPTEKQKPVTDKSPDPVLSLTHSGVNWAGHAEARSSSADSRCITPTRRSFYCPGRSSSTASRAERLSFSAPAGPTNTPVSPDYPLLPPKLRTSTSAIQDKAMSPLYPGSVPLLPVRLPRSPFRPTAFESSCRQEQQQLFYQSSSSSSSNLSSSSTGPNSTRTGNHFSPFPVS